MKMMSNQIREIFFNSVTKILSFSQILKSLLNLLHFSLIIFASIKFPIFLIKMLLMPDLISNNAQKVKKVHWTQIRPL